MRGKISRVVYLSKTEEFDDSVVSAETSKLVNGDRILGRNLLQGQEIRGRFILESIADDASSYTKKCFNQKRVVERLYVDFQGDRWGTFTNYDGWMENFITNSDNLFLLEEITYDSHRE